MNEHDRANLDFLLTADAASLSAWYDTLTKDDLAYAEELLRAAKTELTMRIIESHDDISNVSTAKGILDRYTLK